MKEEAGGFAVTAQGGFGIGVTSENLQRAIESELHEVTAMYPEYLAQAQQAGETAAIRSMTYAVEAEKIHAEMYQQAKDAVDSGKDAELGVIQVCKVCGHTVEGEAPNSCPICSATKDQFEAFE